MTGADILDKLNMDNRPLRDYASKLFSHIAKSSSRLFRELGNDSCRCFTKTISEEFALCSEESYTELVNKYDIKSHSWFIEYEKLKIMNKKIAT